MPMLCIFSHMGVLLFRFLSVCCPFCSLLPLLDRRCSSSWIIALHFGSGRFASVALFISLRAHFRSFVHISEVLQGALQLDG